MKVDVLATALTALVGLSSASPWEKRAHVAYITFIGAADATFSMDFPTDGTPTQITNPLSISKISMDGNSVCHFTGIDGSFTTVVGGQTVDVGPPQTQIWGTCARMQ